MHLIGTENANQSLKVEKRGWQKSVKLQVYVFSLKISPHTFTQIGIKMSASKTGSQCHKAQPFLNICGNVFMYLLHLSWLTIIKNL